LERTTILKVASTWVCGGAQMGPFRGLVWERSHSFKRATDSREEGGGG